MYAQIVVNQRRTALLMAIFFLVIIGLGYVFARIYDSNAILIWAVGISVAMSWMSYFNSDKLALATSRARALRPNDSLEERKIQHLVENLSITAGVPLPKIYIIDDSAPNAFATGRDPKHASIALTRGLIEKLNKVEIEGVIAHELSHVRNWDILLSTVSITLVGIVTLLADWFMRVRISQNDHDRNSGNALVIIGIILAVLAPIFARLLQLAISRKREFLADASGAMLTRYPEGLASALEKIAAYPTGMRVANRATAHLFIANPFPKLANKISYLYSTHPPVEERVRFLREMTLG
ncbi:zinc metalloprotease HtpX [candidate division Kazan bacterium RIFCSPHIGHO2_01_FULL_44_14]|uniref:Protease HtpX homolog n=1 Tax=candidate division Kazan bacterium RIFCSPLOWO2_01_FULL_45_19 TaxID=1798538 RepID=A0A1F4NPN9_UNCK3|nr:hypothetical protein [uncultured bacterium]OGB73423.1 MAG: zinc metalloprotease HtpX [candidate division Kazan bacterium RIFCSPLOWO2_01_FULL_45_19]OGB77668.1 MAG: zinc metalloprotease HtpX [candidate division Kazan bacterium RIFCSPHIGHO2_01_FULL_44_14]